MEIYKYLEIFWQRNLPRKTFFIQQIFTKKDKAKWSCLLKIFYYSPMLIALIWYSDSQTGVLISNPLTLAV